MKLEAYLHKCGLTQGEFAAQLGVSQSTVSKWLAGHMPRRGMVQKIARLTDGAVPATSWFEEPARGENGEPACVNEAAP